MIRIDTLLGNKLMNGGEEVVLNGRRVKIISDTFEQRSSILLGQFRD